MTTNRITQYFAGSPNNNLCLYFTAGYPALHDTLPLLQTLQEHGADLVEIGIPYSDPLADGPTIQHSSQIALQNGMTLQLLLQQLQDMRTTIHIPVLLMGYWNSILQYGPEAFCKDAAAAGIDGVILPDLPPEVYIRQYQGLFEQYGLCFVPLITPATPSARILQYDAIGNGFLYLVSAHATTGQSFSATALQENTNRLSALQLRLPVLTGFGLSSAADLQTVFRFTNGGIIGSALIRSLTSATDVTQAAQQFMQSLHPVISTP
jgi:tryptophan synthase alpha chain